MTVKPTFAHRGTPKSRRGEVARERLVVAARELLETVPYRDLKVSEIAQRANASKAAFYQYYSNIEDIILALVADASRDGESLIAFAETQWPADSITHNIRQFVEAYYDYWDRYRTILRVRDILAFDGDRRFLVLRMEVVTPLSIAISRKAEHGTDDAGAPQAPSLFAVACVLMSSIERNASSYPSYPGKQLVGRGQLIDATIYLLEQFLKPPNTLTAPRP
jgi:AcrR family transcriptional regulator